MPAIAAGGFDGNWEGSASSAGRTCAIQGVVTLRVEGETVSGSVKFPQGNPTVRGTVSDAGAFTGKAGTQDFEGKFKGGTFEGQFMNGSNCRFQVSAERKK